MHLQSNRAKNSEKESSKGKLYLKGEQTVKTANLIRLSLNLRGGGGLQDDRFCGYERSSSFIEFDLNAT